MDAEFWLGRWQAGRTAWQEVEPGAMLVRHFAVPELAQGARVFIPFCRAPPDPE